MAGYDLNYGKYKDVILTEEDLWKAFKMVFSTKTVNTSSYKFVFLKSILDCIKRYDAKEKYTFYEIYERFTEIYWVLVVKYGLSQSNSTTKVAHVEQILQEYVGCTADDKLAKIEFDDLTDSAKKKIIDQVSKKCKKYVVGALYEDTQEIFYSFSKKEEWIRINPKMLAFLDEHGSSIEELNYFELTKFLNKVNSRIAVERITRENHYKICEDSLNVYRQMLYDEFESDSNIKRENYELNTIEILMVADEAMYAAEKNEEENNHLKRLVKKGQVIESDSQSMMLYLDDPERIIKMLKVRKGIYC